MNNFPFDYNGNTYWYSRSIVVNIYVYCKDRSGEWKVLACKRGSGVPMPGKLNVPGGFLDFNETPDKAVRRELWEETGLDLKDSSKWKLTLCEINFSPSNNKSQHIIYSYCVVLPGICEDYVLTNSNSELNEVDEIEWKHVNLLGRLATLHTWICNQDYIAKKYFNTFVNLSAMDRWELGIEQKILKKYIK